MFGLVDKWFDGCINNYHYFFAFITVKAIQLSIMCTTNFVIEFVREAHILNCNGKQIMIHDELVNTNVQNMFVYWFLSRDSFILPLFSLFLSLSLSLDVNKWMNWWLPLLHPFIYLAFIYQSIYLFIYFLLILPSIVMIG